MSSVIELSESIKCVAKHLAKAAKEVLGVDENQVLEYINTGKIKVQRTPDPKLGDYGFAIHILLKNIDKLSWSEYGERLARTVYLNSSSECYVESASFVNGYLNVSFNYTNMLVELAKKWALGDLARELCQVGGGAKVIVEHTSANPLHPLHIGSGRNSVLGDTLARLLRKLGFSVETRFYVNDLGRQVATLVFGVSLVKASGVEKPREVKVDHWYGGIYALTNILISLNKLSHELRDAATKVFDRASSALELLRVRVGEDLELQKLVAELANFTEKRYFIVSYVKEIGKLHKLLRDFMNKVHEDRVKKALVELLSDVENYLRLYREYVSYLKALARLAATFPEVYTVLASNIKSYVDAENKIKELMVRAEREDPQTLALFRHVAEEVVEGFKETLKNLNIEFTGFDYESNREILELAHSIVEDLLKTPYARIVEGGAVEVSLDLAAMDHDYVKNLFHPDQPGRFIVRRSDKTTLYVTRDVAYTIYKFRVLGAEKVYNVIAAEQTREQKQLKAVLYLLGLAKEADNLHHFSYEMVHLKGVRMSGRRGVYYTLDEMLVDAEATMFKKLIDKRGHAGISDAETRDVARSLAVANIRALLLSVEPNKVMVFDPGKLESTDYASIIEYAFVRSQGIIRNMLNIEPLDNAFELLRHLSEAAKILEEAREVVFSTEEKLLVERLLEYKNVLMESYRELKLNRILEYALNLSLEFNRFYEKYPVAKEQDPVKRAARLSITILTLLTLSELMDIMGMPKLRKM
ncbi:MAG: arginine--tRNA ligase [Desulfurococcaceae archaeon]